MTVLLCSSFYLKATVRKFRTVQKEGNRQVERLSELFNLDMILADGYRIRSHVGTKFRQWATGVLKEYKRLAGLNRILIRLLNN
ncbi:MAG: virulence RhuM family protein [bacterium]|nr:virulence RhuM family protein [bacterium]